MLTKVGKKQIKHGALLKNSKKTHKSRSGAKTFLTFCENRNMQFVGVEKMRLASIKKSCDRVYFFGEVMTEEEVYQAVLYSDYCEQEQIIGAKAFRSTRKKTD